MSNKINLTDFQQEKIHTTIDFKGNVVEIYNPTDEQRGKILELVEKVGKDIESKDLIVELIKMLTNITIGKNPEKVLENPNETLMEIIEVITDIMNDITTRYFKNVSKLIEQDKLLDGVLPKEVKDKLNEITEIENKVASL